MSLSWAILNVAIAIAILFAFVFKTLGRVLPILPVQCSLSQNALTKQVIALLAFSLFYRSSFKKAKKCNGDLMKKHSSHNKPPPLDKFNPFCPNKQDRPDPTSGGNEKAIISGVLSLITFAYFALM